MGYSRTLSVVIVVIPAPFGVWWVVSGLTSMLFDLNLSKNRGKFGFLFPYMPVSIIVIMLGLVIFIMSFILVSLSLLLVLDGNPLTFYINILNSVVVSDGNYLGGIHIWSVFVSVSHIQVFITVFFIPASSFSLNSMVDWFIVDNFAFLISLLSQKIKASFVYPSRLLIS